MKRLYNKKGFTLVELLIGLALVGVIITTATSLIIFAIRSQETVSNEFDIQADMRLASEVINQELRHASAVFILNDDQYSNDTISNGWSYFGLSDDGKEILHYAWNEASDSHVKTTLVSARSEISYNMNFVKDEDESFMIRFLLDGLLENGQLKTSITSHLNALNTVVVDDAGTLMSPGISLAYRLQDIPDPEKVKVAVTLILDTSGSMGNQMGGGDSSIRMTNMKVRGKELIDTFADMGNVYISLVPFATTASNPDPFISATDNRQALKDSIDSFNASGGTNAGDGLRQSYYLHDDFNTNLASDESVLNYAILLMDGSPTYYPVRDGQPYYGSGNNSDRGGGGGSYNDASLNYIKNFSDIKIKITDASQNVYLKTFVIGFTGVVAEVERSEEIAGFHKLDGDDRIDGFYYEATSSEALANAFKAISDFILQETWHIFGPTN